MIGKILSHLFVIVLVYFVALSGCNSRQTYVKKQYVLAAMRHSESLQTEVDSILEVCRFTIDSAYSGKGLVYRLGEFEYQSDFYNEFLTSPAAMITEKTRNWLAESGLFGTVSDMGSLVDPTHFIEGNVTALYGDFRDKSSPKATMEIRIFLLKAKTTGESTPVFERKYQATVDIVSEDPEDLVKALDKCLENILSSLEKDLIGQIG
jgi:cholesterol transport system auxiliary component